jgi:hypothetical protein
MGLERFIFAEVSDEWNRIIAGPTDFKSDSLAFIGGCLVKGEELVLVKLDTFHLVKSSGIDWDGTTFGFGASALGITDDSKDFHVTRFQHGAGENVR